MTWEELADKYATAIRKAVRNDGPLRMASLTETRVRELEGFQTLKKVHKNLKGLVYTDTREPLSKEDRQEIAERIAEKLGVKTPKKFRIILREASNDNYVQVVNVLSQISQNVLRK
jgi:hypothetical protein